MTPEMLLAALALVAVIALALATIGFARRSAGMLIAAGVMVVSVGTFAVTAVALA